jgi:hypothetical protein
VNGLLVVLFVASLLGAWNWWSRERVVTQPPGVLAPAEPEQHDLDPAPGFAHHGYELRRRARYDITARVLRKEIYRLDGGAGLAPVDLGVGWGPMSDSTVIGHLRFSQMGRFFYWELRDTGYPLAPKDLQTHAAQMHMVPADDALASRLKNVRPGQVVSVHGYLVDIRGPGGFAWNTSLRRDDTGDGACEIVYVESLEVR